eukprot:TRINITY_DN4874_c0_g1_i3.p1 TRINITY_DN4874_c0_g1~~TRINITY_DN4874_c0_g1_i3.p1  ORF type:complete len:162 (+),score=49.52 TRINITY_DN4874_c0_g1_i3:102-587(+)
MIRRPPRSTLSSSSAASDVYKRQVTAYSPLGSGVEINGQKVIDHPKLIEIAKKHEKSAAQVVTAWLIKRGIIVIPKSTHKERIVQNLDVFNFTLDEQDMKDIAALNANARAGFGGAIEEDKDGNPLGPRDRVHPDFPFSYPNVPPEADAAEAEGENETEAQ